MTRNNSQRCFALVAIIFMLQLNGWAQQSGTGQSAERPTGAITGRVVNSAGEPLPGATVTSVSLLGTRAQTATVNSSGDFKINGLDAGLYRLSTTMPGYTYAFQPSSSDPPAYYHIGDSVTITLTKGAVITGTVTGPNGPLIGVGVFATRVRDETGEKLPRALLVRERSTDDRGTFRLYGLPPGAYLISAAKPRIGMVAPSAYDYDSPTYFPSATRDTASEITVRDGDETTADIQYRAEPGHAISGKVVGVIESPGTLSFSSISLTDVRSGASIAGVGTTAADGHSFAIYGLPDGEYELTASEYLPTRDGLSAPPQRVTLRGADVTGLSFTLTLMATIEGRFVFESDANAGCAKRKETAAAEALVYARRFEPEKTGANAKSEAPAAFSSSTYSAVSAGDAKGSFVLRSLPTGRYRIDPRPPASGWYIKSIAIGTIRPAPAKAANVNTARDGIQVKGGERVTGVLVTITEGAARVRGRISAAEGQTLPPRMSVYFVPAEREAVNDVLRFYEGRTEADQSFTIDNVSPGKYFITTRPSEKTESGAASSIRQDGNLRTTILQEAIAAKKEVSLKPCERIADYDLPYSPPPKP